MIEIKPQNKAVGSLKFPDGQDVKIMIGVRERDGKREFLLSIQHCEDEEYELGVCIIQKRTQLIGLHKLAKHGDSVGTKGNDVLMDTDNRRVY